MLFCNVIATSDVDDLHRLELFVSTLQSSADGSGIASNFSRLCNVFYQVANLYIEGKTQSAFAAINEFDQYLDALGFGQNPQGGMGLESWFQGNQFVMDLMEQDLSYLDRPQ